MKVYVLVNTYHGEERIQGVVTDKAKAEKYAKRRGNWFEEEDLDGCLGELGLLDKKDKSE